ncbi:hypothetical protein GCM10009092_26460 [Bowmanella denitrificans]|uniref:Phosphohistidine phosphatase n=1 Tax=Bowmanella denitrificans TaxID=366582 RepID=A0ABN0XCL8_9ALTE|nr:histidine phosphatase family protein [Bowmanella denitrificans]
MKQVLLLRHAKSSWKHVVDDEFRPLNARGYRDAPVMAETLRGRLPDKILCSPSIRTYSTAMFYLRNRDMPLELLHLDWALYEASGDRLMRYLLALDNSWQSVWLFGHNPGLNELVELATGQAVDNIVTGARVQLQWPVKDWQALQDGQARLIGIDAPQKQ